MIKINFINYNDVFSLVVEHISIRMLLVTVVEFNLALEQWILKLHFYIET